MLLSKIAMYHLVVLMLSLQHLSAGCDILWRNFGYIFSEVRVWLIISVQHYAQFQVQEGEGWKEREKRREREKG